MSRKSYNKGYRLENYAALTLEYNGFHVKRNYRSLGVEDIISASRENIVYFIQCKNYDWSVKHVLHDEQVIFKWHAEEYGAIPIWLFSPGRGKKVWFNLSTLNSEIDLKEYTKEWMTRRMKIKKKLRKLKKKNVNEYNRFVLKHWKSVKDFIC